MQKQILIVEDNEINRSILNEILSREYQVLEAENGLQALELVHRYKDSISLILLDVMMPVMDGYTFLDHLKSDAELSLIPVIVMTQSDSEEGEIAALSHGATDFVPKPYRPQVILHRVASLIKLRETAAVINQLRYDRLTGLYSKEFFYEKVRERLQESPAEGYNIVCSNIENFKLVNDIFGVQAGDRLLKEVAVLAQKMVGKNGFCGRFSADRFLCLQKRNLEQQDRNNFGNVTDLEPSPLLKSVTMRWGIYEITDRSVPVEQMCDRAQLAADSIKGQYNQYFAVYDDSLRSKLLREQAITAAMETALDKGQFVVYYQPKYSLNDDRIAGAEALVRWIHPDLGAISPGEFVPLFEKNGFISKMDLYVWEQVCRQLRVWKEKGKPMVPISVNISRADVFQTQLADTLQELTGKYDIDPSYLHLEITETAYAENPHQIIHTIAQLRRLGFIVEMDDFGSGYSSLNTLSQIDLDILKLDMKFTQHEIAKPADKSILDDIIRMAHRVHLGVVAEGVETREQLERLQAAGCDYAQGYYLAKPMPAAEFETLLKTQPVEPAITSRNPRREDAGIRSLLIVEEDPEYREQVRQTFEKEYRIFAASDADSALAYLRCPDCVGISAVILSMTLPENSAGLLLKALRQDPALWRIPVLATIPQCNARRDATLPLDTDDFLCKCHPLADLHRRLDRLVRSTSRNQMEYTLREEANRDYITGLLNRRGLQATLAALRKDELPLAICLFDLDDLKVINDTHGHNAGDRMISTFAELLRSRTRSGDILCRYGGDEFVIILKHMTDAANAKKKCEDICRSFREQLAAGGRRVSCSAGIALCHQEQVPLTQWIERADQALYQAKRQSKGSCCLWEEQEISTGE